MAQEMNGSICVKMTVDDKLIPLKGFVQDFIGYTIMGILKSLKGIPATPKEITVNIKVNE